MTGFHTLHLGPGLTLIATLTVACDEVPETAGGGGSGGGSDDPFASGTLVEVVVEQARVFVDLDAAAIVTEGDDWDLAFQGRDVLTNGGVSGPGDGAAFVLDRADFAGSSVPPEVPFLIEDQTGGPFIDWYAYDGELHQVYSRFHVFGVRRDDELYKVQIISFYGEVEGAPVPAMYQLRAARVNEDGADPTELYQNVDGTAGGPAPDPNVPSECIRLATGARLALTPDEARESSDWDLCFRRDAISLNGGDGGSAGVEAVDLMVDQSSGETLAEVRELTADGELAAFDDTSHAQLTDATLAYRGDGVVTAFTDKWLALGSQPLAPTDHAWLVGGSDGETPFFVGFEAFDGATAEAVGTIQLRVKKIGGTLP